MSATHELTVLSVSGAKATVEIRLVHPDEHEVWLLKTAMLSMLYASLDVRTRVKDSVREDFDEAGGDEPEDTASASRILKKVELLKVVRGSVASQSKKRVTFARRQEAKGAEPVVRVKLTATQSQYLAHLRKGVTWLTAPLFPELDGGLSGPEPRARPPAEAAKDRGAAAPQKGSSRKAILNDRVIYLGRQFPFGEGVCIAQRAGTIKPVETQGPEVDAAPPARGTILGIDEAARREKGEDRYVARVRWDAQVWQTWPEHQAVALGPFESTIHLDYLAPSPAPASS